MRPLTAMLLSVLTMLAAASCTTDPIEVQPASPGTPGGGAAGGNNGNPGTNPPDTALCFERDILPIFISNCAKSGCHDAASAQDGYVFTSFETITAKKFRAGDASETELYEKITERDRDDIMPPPPNAPLSSTQIALIGRWINDGARNTRDCKPVCDSTRFAFAADIQPILNTSCTGCHSAATASGGVRLDSYAGVRAVALDGRLYGAISHSPGFSAMPQGSSRLDDCTIARVRNWIQAGATNN